MKRFQYKLIVLVLLAVSLALFLFFRFTLAAPAAAPSPQEGALQLLMPHALAAQVEGSDQLSALEERLGQPVNILSYQSESSELFSLCSHPDFKGIIFLQDPLSIVSLSQQKLLLNLSEQLKQLPISNVDEQFSARYQGIQYGIVLPQSTENPFYPLIALRTDILEQYQYSGFPDSVDDCTGLFDQIRSNGLIPFAAYGMPASNSFAPLLSLFSLNSSGNGELRLVQSRISYDKVSAAAQPYLAFIHDCYAHEFLPTDFLSLDCLGAMDLFIRGRSPLLVVSTLSEASLLHTLCEKYAVPHDFELVRSGSGYTHIPAIRNRSIIAVSSHASELASIQNFSRLLLTDPSVQELFRIQFTPWEEWLIQRFDVPDAQMRLDPVSLRPVYLRLMQIFNQLNSEIIEPYYAKITTGDLSQDSFWEMCEKWSDSGGENLLEMLTRYVYK